MYGVTVNWSNVTGIPASHGENHNTKENRPH